MKILFICKYNRFRSKVAEAYFNEVNKNKKNKARSAGIIKGSPLGKLQVSVAKSLGLNIKGKPRGISTDLLKWQDTIIIVADDVPISLFKDNKKYGKKTIVWKISDIKNDNKKAIERTIKVIMKKIERLR